MKTNILRLLIIVMVTLTCYSCKKEKSPTPITVPAPSALIGKYAYTGPDNLVRDTIYVYEQSSSYYMTCPDLNCSASLDTISVTIDNTNITIPTQPIYGGSGGLTITGTANGVGPTQLTLNWNTQTYSKSNIFYYKQ